MGGTGGLGVEIVKKFQAGGWNTTSLGTNDLDLLDREAIKRYFQDKRCDLLICAAGIIRDSPLISLSEKSWDETLQVNFTGIAAGALAMLKIMAVHGSGHVIFVSSYAALHPTIGQSAYATAKACLLGLTKELAQQFGKNGLRVNAVLPGFLETAMTSGVTERRKSEILEAHTLSKFNTPRNVADFLWFLEEDLPFTSGQIFSLDSRI